jgi:error-prone DNA polymerase
LLVYISSWLKCHHPAAFAAALLNSQPMGFYAPAQIVRDARAHGVQVHGADVNASEWDCTLQDGALRLGFRMIDGFHASWSEKLITMRGDGFADFHALTQAGLPRPALETLAGADALTSLNQGRRLALWRVAGLEAAPPLPLLAGQRRRHAIPSLPLMTQGEQVIADYRSTGLSLRAHPMQLLRQKLIAAKTITCAEAISAKDGASLRTAGIVTVRQRPGTAKGTIFITIEDETGIANIIVWPSLVETYRNPIISASLLIVEGRLQRSVENVTHIVATRLADRSRWIAELDAGENEARQKRPPGHPRQERVVRKSRDFH